MVWKRAETRSRGRPKARWEIGVLDDIQTGGERSERQERMAINCTEGSTQTAIKRAKS